MSELNTKKMPKFYAAICFVIAAAYGIWMNFFMKDIVLNHYSKVAARTVDGAVHKDITGIHSVDTFYFWLILSCITLLLFAVYISTILYAGKLSGTIKAVCLISLLFGLVYINVYGFLSYYGMIDGAIKEATLQDKIKVVTASMIGLEWPWLFRGWGIFASASIFMNTMYTYRRYNYNNKAAVILGLLGSAAIYMTINLPSYGENKDFSVPRCSVHWAGALLFAACCAAPLIIFLFSKAIKEKGRFLVALIAFAGILLLMLVLLVTVGKSAVIENIPMIVAYVLLFILNFTNVFGKQEA